MTGSNDRAASFIIIFHELYYWRGFGDRFGLLDPPNGVLQSQFSLTGNEDPSVGAPDDVTRRTPCRIKGYASQTELFALLAQHLQTPIL